MDDLAYEQEPAPLAPMAKVGAPGGPSIAAWQAEIRADLQVALAKIKQLPAAEQALTSRIARAIEVHITQ